MRHHHTSEKQEKHTEKHTEKKGKRLTSSALQPITDKHNKAPTVINPIIGI